ncbi:class I SAM-dependent rRNA methyltransferase [Pseudohongiella nitratireducens]|uniref:class I SAM-dependent rRNA methyltransferase n=1 Tax=Pseudohongiella nitratireducens TaxID=1768907 RepID=UPI0030ED7ACF|tara:strand:- start:2422 stop:3654 length:1233 start_codon:yes stop_codon:yes gene_type:complete
MTDFTADVLLKKGREASLRRHHPWVFSGAIASINAGTKGKPEAGDTVRVLSAGGEVLGKAAWSPESQIRARMWTFDAPQRASEQVDESLIQQRIQHAIRRRQPLRSDKRTALRLIYGESDGLPGLVVDQYGDFLSCQFLTIGIERWRDTVINALQAETGCKGIYERSDVSVRKHEGLKEQSGRIWGEAPPAQLVIHEHDRQYQVSIASGHKTGYYLDQYDNRQWVQQLCARQGQNWRVLNCFSYTGGFGIAALAGGARQVVNVDASEPALQSAAANAALNGFADTQSVQVQANVFEYLRELRQQNEQFDLIILDPPKFADTRHQFKKAARAYKDIAMQAAHLLSPGGYLINFSCSGAIDMPLFQKITADALLDAERQGAITGFLSQSEDHPVALAFPEARYLKGLVSVLD